jgi:starvation-inducible DNA-binding protein
MSTISKLNGILADIHVLIVKLHNFHWNIAGMEFHGIHSATEAYYKHFFAEFDEVAERILQLGDKPYSTVKGLLKGASLKDDTQTSFTAAYVLEAIIADFTQLLAAAKSANKSAEKDEDIATQGLMGGMIAFLEKELWILKATLNN